MKDTNRERGPENEGPQQRQSNLKKIEWPTLGLACVIYSSWLALTYWHDALGWWVMAPLCAWMIAWHGSLQHEILHGHPTRSRNVNRALASVPISLWLPYESYRISHLVHHADESLTDPLDDPESRYITPADWQRLSAFERKCLRVQKTLIGRLTLGPAWTVSHFLMAETRKIVSGDAVALYAWRCHALPLALVLIWLTFVCEINLFFYIFAVVYPSISLMLIRSFAEHKAAPGVRERTAIVENAGVLGWLFLFNNLHAAHHERPTMPWYEIPAWYRQNRERLLQENDGLRYDGYLDVARRYLLTAHDAVTHPQGRVSNASHDFTPLPPASPSACP
jgi:fatty acid desaturase